MLNSVEIVVKINTKATLKYPGGLHPTTVSDERVHRNVFYESRTRNGRLFDSYVTNHCKPKTNGVQRLACIGITDAMSTTFTDSLNTLLDLLSWSLFTMG